jgi:hypothetical protein
MHRLLRKSLLALACAALASGAAQAQIFRAYLSITGNDANPCTVAAPCRLLPAALNAVADGGEIWLLDSANFNAGTVNVNKSVSIVAAPGQVASIVAAGGQPALVVGNPGLTIGLRNLAFTKNANNPGTTGVYVTAASQVSIENCLFANLATQGIWLNGGTAVVHVRDSVFRNIANNAMLVMNGGTAYVLRSQFFSTGGLNARLETGTATTTLEVADSQISGGNTGVAASMVAASGTTRAFVTRSTIQGMTAALYAQTADSGSATVAVSSSSIVGNNQPYFTMGTGAAIKSMGNNDITGNALVGNGTFTTFVAQ